MTIRTYSELAKLSTFEERFVYLKLDGVVGENQTQVERYLNQQFYRSAEWRRIRRDVILRDNGYDLGVSGHEIFGFVSIHHMNPITSRDILEHSELVLDPEYLISVSRMTHNAIHYSDAGILPKGPTERTPHDMVPWKTS